MSTNPIVHVVDDDEAARDSLTFLLETAKRDVRAYASAMDFLKAADDLAPGCILTDVRMPGMSGIELLSRLKQMGVALPVIVMTGHGDIALAVEAMKSGAADFLEKPFDDEKLLAAVDSALAAQANLGAREAEKRRIAERIGALSARERDVLKGLVAGRANKVIAQDLGISPRTVEIYRANLMSKMQASSLSDLVRAALTAGDFEA
ncbi:MAG: response regulator FixJ [Hyphomonadaceae bacterium]